MQTLFEWVGEYKDLLALFISLVALVVGLMTIRIARRQARLDTYARMHETLVAPGVAKGRRLLFTAYRRRQFPTYKEDGWDETNQALALYDTLGTYYQRKLVPQDLLLAAWHHPLKAVTPAAKAFVEHREALGIRQPWPMLNQLLAAAAAVDCSCNYCVDFRRQQGTVVFDHCECPDCLKARSTSSQAGATKTSAGGGRS
jgi:hypothetical protein